MYKKGMIVIHTVKTEWGPGKVVDVSDKFVNVYFRVDDNDKPRRFFIDTFALKIADNQSIKINYEPPLQKKYDKSKVLKPQPKVLKPQPVIKIPKPRQIDYVSLLSEINYFENPTEIKSFDELKNNLPPRNCGIYGWYFCPSPPNIYDNNCPRYTEGWIFKNHWKLLYIGISNNLKRRIFDYHFEGSADVSSLRESLGCLLANELKIYLWVDDHSYTFGKKGEDKLSKWMAKHARVAWIEHNDYEEIEKRAIIRYKPPLNTDENPNKHKALQKLKIALKLCAKLRGEAPPKKAVRKAYKAFEKNCTKS